jgi:hypothetical protein
MRSRRKGRRQRLKRISAREVKRMRTCFGGIEKVLRGREGLVRLCDGRAALELVIASDE